ncbi:ABC transporter ATP-binding protein [Kineosporia sp. NBRC 101677]|uniref:ABC transporter ATP-binding protein n=1 Tax=Kineosporia sp. NBRC 101677 TaxID=3032197 RepID=UPI0024A4F812|nr:ABC transporter ATP-binding protein [Kineosporia sp. NBRC 101677]GLY14247.1 ABC transporter ATP-binding protein [Kineosporia sp. NBRC 101677]
MSAVLTGPPAIRLTDVAKVYRTGAAEVTALHRVSVEVRRGEFLAVMGPSGSGKSTLMHCAAGLDTPSSGEVEVDGVAIGGLSETRRTELRRERIGFVFQSYNLISSLTIADNITLPLRMARRRADPAWVAELVERVGLTERLHHRPAELSGGQQQRAAIARALVARPAVVFADEPTGALDLRAAREVLALLRRMVDELNQTVVMVSHDPAAAAHADRALVMADGRIVQQLHSPTAAELAAGLMATQEAVAAAPGV